MQKRDLKKLDAASLAVLTGALAASMMMAASAAGAGPATSDPMVKGMEAGGQIETSKKPSTGTPEANAPKAVTARPEELIGLSVVTLDGSRIGQVKEVSVDDAGLMTGIDAEIGGLLGFGVESVHISAEDFEVTGDAVVLPVRDDGVEKLTRK